MAPGHRNWMLDTDRAGRSRAGTSLERACSAGTSARVVTSLAGCWTRWSATAPALVLEQRPAAERGAVPRRGAAARAPGGRARRELGPHRRQGRDLAALRRLHRPEPRHGGRPPPLPRHRSGPRRVTGWPQTDVFLRRRPRERYDELLRGYGLDPERPLVLVMGNTPTNAPYEGRFVERLVAWWEENARDRFQLLVRPHPRDKEWRERFARRGARGRATCRRRATATSTTSRRSSSTATSSSATRARSSWTRSSTTGPSVCVLYDEGAPPGESWAAKNVIGEHYRQLAASGAFHTAETFDEVVGRDRALADCLFRSSRPLINPFGLQIYPMHMKLLARMIKCYFLIRYRRQV